MRDEQIERLAEALHVWLCLPSDERVCQCRDAARALAPVVDAMVAEAWVEGCDAARAYKDRERERE